MRVVYGCCYGDGKDVRVSLRQAEGVARGVVDWGADGAGREGLGCRCDDAEH